MESLLLALQSAISAYQPPPFVIVDTQAELNPVQLAIDFTSAVVLIATLGFLAFQTKAMVKSVAHSARSAKAAEDAVAVSRQAHVAQARAYVTARVDLTESVPEDSSIAVGVIVENVGETPALDVAIDGGLALLGSDEELLNQPRLEPAARGTNGRAVLTKSLPAVQRYWLNVPESEALRQRASHVQSLHLYVAVAIEYTNCLDGSRHRTDFAARLAVDEHGQITRAGVTSVGNHLT